MAYWDKWHGCCDCVYGRQRGNFDFERYGDRGHQFVCERTDEVASSHHKPDDKCEDYERKVK